MNRFVIAVFILCYIAVFPAVSGADELDFSGVEWAPGELDHLRVEADSLRVLREFDEAGKACAEILRISPGDGFALRELALIERDSGRLRYAARELARGDLGLHLEEASLSVSDLLFVRGLIDHYRCKYRSASAMFEKALEERPGWGWARLYLGRTRQQLMAPKKVWMDDFQAALDDPDSAPALVSHILGVYPPYTFAEYVDVAKELIDRFGVAPGFEPDYRYNKLFEELRSSSRMTPDEAADRWKEIRNGYPMLAVDGISIIKQLTSDYGVKAFDRFAEAAEPMEHEQTIFAIARADRLDDEDRRIEAAATLRAVNDSSLSSAGILLSCALVHGSPDELREAAEFCLAEKGDFEAITQARFAADLLSDSRLDSLVKDARNEFPIADFILRTGRLISTDLTRAEALLDSLDEAGVEHGYLLTQQIDVWERLGDTTRVDKAISSLPQRDRGWYLGRALVSAASRGDMNRAGRLLGERIGIDPDDIWNLTSALGEARSIKAYDRIASLTEMLVDKRYEAKNIPQICIDALISLNRHEEAGSLIREAALDRDLAPFISGDLAVTAQYMGLAGAADTLIATAERIAPGSPYVRTCRASVYMARGENPEAREILKELAAEYPGNTDVRSRLLSAGGSVQDVVDQEDEEMASAFRVFDHDLKDIDWILQAAEKADTMSGVDAVFLLNRTSVSVHARDHGLERKRITVLIRKDSAIEVFQPYHIGFDAADNIPRVRLARVIHRDGTVVEVPRSDIVVVSDPDENIDVDDSRAVAIPFPGLKAGSMIDLVYDEETTSWYSSGFSSRYLFTQFYPVLRSTVELVYQKGLDLVARGVSGAPEGVRTVHGNEAVVSWTINDLEPYHFENYAPTLYDHYPWVGISTHGPIESAFEQFRSDFWARVKVTGEIEGLAKEITKGIRKKREKAEAVFKEVLERVTYVAIELGRGRIIPSTPEEVLKRGYGDCKDMVSLLIALYESLDIEAEPVLLSDRVSPVRVEGLNEPFLCDHVIIHIPGADGLFADPTSDNPCIDQLPVNLAGVEGVIVPRAGDVEIVDLPSLDTDDNFFTMEMDLWPEGNEIARIEVRGEWKGILAKIVRSSVGLPDKHEREEYLVAKLGHGLWDSCVLRDWSVEKDDCDGVVIVAQFEDTSWANNEMNTVNFNWSTEVADPIICYPASKDRVQDFLNPFPFMDEVRIRLHNSKDWEIKPVISFAVSGDEYEGRISSNNGDGDGDSWIEVCQEFQITRERFSTGQFKTFHDDYVRFMAGVYQNYSYRRVIEDQEIEKIQEYVDANPGDAGFVLQTALKILGSDVGGDGEQGRKRRTIVRRLLESFSGKPEAGCWPPVLLSGIEAKEGRYYKADSLMSLAMKLEPGNIIVESVALAYKNELKRFDEAIELYKSLIQHGGGTEVELAYIITLSQMGRDDEAASVINRYYLLHGRSDSLKVRQAMLYGALEAEQCDKAEAIYGSIKNLIAEKMRNDLHTSVLLSCERFNEAADLLESLWEKNPYDPTICNNLAWCYALLGRKLDRAEELIDLAIMLSPDNTASRNTSATIAARRGNWKEALGIFRELSAGDDRPESRASNDFFVGLCEYYLGRKDECISLWEKIAGMENVGSANLWARRGLDLHAKGEPVTRAIFVEESK